MGSSGDHLVALVFGVKWKECHQRFGIVAEESGRCCSSRLSIKIDKQSLRICYIQDYKFECH